MLIEENKAIARRFIEGKGIEKFDCLHENSVFWVAGPPPMGGSRSRSEMIEGARGFLKMQTEPFCMTIVSMIAEGDMVTAEAKGGMTLANGKVYSNQYHFAFEIKDGKIIAAREYYDTDHVREIFAAP